MVKNDQNIVPLSNLFKSSILLIKLLAWLLQKASFVDFKRSVTLNSANRIIIDRILQDSARFLKILLHLARFFRILQDSDQLELNFLLQKASFVHFKRSVPLNSASRKSPDKRSCRYCQLPICFWPLFFIGAHEPGFLP